MGKAPVAPELKTFGPPEFWLLKTFDEEAETPANKPLVATATAVEEGTVTPARAGALPPIPPRFPNGLLVAVATTAPNKGAMADDVAVPAADSSPPPIPPAAAAAEATPNKDAAGAAAGAAPNREPEAATGAAATPNTLDTPAMAGAAGAGASPVPFKLTLFTPRPNTPTNFAAPDVPSAPFSDKSIASSAASPPNAPSSLVQSSPLHAKSCCP